MATATAAVRNGVKGARLGPFTRREEVTGVGGLMGSTRGRVG